MKNLFITLPISLSMYSINTDKFLTLINSHWYFFPALFFTVKLGDALTTFIALNYYTQFFEKNQFAVTLFNSIGLLPSLCLLLFGGTLFITLSIEGLLYVTPSVSTKYKASIRLCGYLPITLVSFYFTLSNIFQLTL